MTVEIPKVRDGGYKLTLTAPTDGTLLARLDWQGPNDMLQMRVGDALFGELYFHSGDPVPASVARLPDGRLSISGSVSVTGGRPYRIGVASVPGYWDYGAWIASSFTLTTSMR